MIINGKNFLSLAAYSKQNKTDNTDASKADNEPKSLAELMADSNKKAAKNSLFTSNAKVKGLDKVSLSPEAIKVLKKEAPELLKTLGIEIPESDKENKPENKAETNKVAKK